jgi:hypothetical protein
MLELWLRPQLLQDKPNVVSGHDGAPSHSHYEVTTFLNRRLPEGWIGLGGGGPIPGLRGLQIWPHLDFFLWGFVKDELYVPPMPITLNNFRIE